MTALYIWMTIGVWLGCISLIRADTEIRNFRLPSAPTEDGLEPSTLSAGNRSYFLTSQDRQLHLRFTAQTPNIAVELMPSPGDELYTSWTARLSWPGSTPTKFDLDLRARDGHATLKIAASPLSPRIPHDNGTSRLGRVLSPLLVDPYRDDSEDWTTHAHLVFEPLILGAVPRTALRTIGLLLAFAFGAGLTVPYVQRGMTSFLSSLDDGARKSDESRKKQ